MRTVVDDIVLTRHPSGTATETLTARLTAAASDPIQVLYAAPLTTRPVAAPNGDLLTFTPRTDGLGRDEEPPWVAAGALLARLHRCPVPEGLPEHGGRAQLRAATDAATVLHPGGPTNILRELGATLLGTWPEPTTPAVVHGGWNLSALGRMPGTPGWVLTGPETLGTGDPAWDLGGPAGLWAAGLLDDASWQAFLRGYASAGGEVPPEGRPWSALDHPAQCAVYMATVRELGRCGDEPSAQATTLIEACVRMNGRRW